MAGPLCSRDLGATSRARGRKLADDRKLIGVKGTHYLHKRMREACRADGMTTAELISSLLDLRDRDIKRRVGAGNPLSF